MPRSDRFVSRVHEVKLPIKGGGFAGGVELRWPGRCVANVAIHCEDLPHRCRLKVASRSSGLSILARGQTNSDRSFEPPNCIDCYNSLMSDVTRLPMATGGRTSKMARTCTLFMRPLTLAALFFENLPYRD